MPIPAMRGLDECASHAAFVFFDQNFALSSGVGLSDDAFQFHPFHQRGGTGISDLEPTLNVAGGSLAVALDDRHGLRKQVAAAVPAHAGGVEHRAVFVDGLLL